MPTNAAASDTPSEDAMVANPTSTPTTSTPSLEPQGTIEEPLAPLVELADGIPEVIGSVRQLKVAVDALAAGSGPVALDAERASGYRYGQRAYLVQIKREGAGSFLIDPTRTGSLRALQPAIGDAEWVLHAASQDLPCLAELDLTPSLLFDTELAGRLAGCARVGLGPLVENLLGLRLEKGHGAADWSTRPLPDAWLRYAALDVEVLIELRDVLESLLRDQGKLDWAHEEFAAIVSSPGPRPKVDPWRRTSGMHRLRRPRQIAAVRELWLARDDVARRKDTSPGRVLSDAAIVEAATTMPASRDDLAQLASFSGRGARRSLEVWWSAVETARGLSEDQLPRTSPPIDGPPPARVWPDKDPESALRLSAARAAVAAIADEHGLPVENLLAPEVLRRLCWQPDHAWAEAEVDERLRALGARNWQRSLTVTAITSAVRRAEARRADLDATGQGEAEAASGSPIA